MAKNKLLQRALGLGVPIGVSDCKGNPIHIGDTLSFDEKEYGAPCVFTVELKGGEILHPGAPSDLSAWCEIVRAWDSDG